MQSDYKEWPKQLEALGKRTSASARREARILWMKSYNLVPPE
jgi:hypothetical protein